MAPKIGKTPSENLVVCPDCGGNEVILIGELPDVHTFAGRWLLEPINGGKLYDCSYCALRFKFPICEPSELMSRYENAQSTYWSGREIRRPDYDICETLLLKYKPTGKLLDIGCHTGEFLQRFRNTHSVYGIELIPDAAKVARNNEVDIVGADFRCLQSLNVKFDVITAIDVIEHVANPAEFIAIAAGGLEKGGVLIISTGNSRSRAWRFFRARYWYCSYPEHLAFICEDWLKHVTRRNTLSLAQLEIFRRFSPIGINQVFSDIFAQLIYLLWPGMWRLIQRKRGQDPGLPPGWRLALDHIAVVIRNA